MARHSRRHASSRAVFAKSRVSCLVSRVQLADCEKSNRDNSAARQGATRDSREMSRHRSASSAKCATRRIGSHRRRRRAARSLLISGLFESSSLVLASPSMACHRMLWQGLSWRAGRLQVAARIDHTHSLTHLPAYAPLSRRAAWTLSQLAGSNHFYTK